MPTISKSFESYPLALGQAQIGLEMLFGLGSLRGIVWSWVGLGYGMLGFNLFVFGLALALAFAFVLDCACYSTTL